MKFGDAKIENSIAGGLSFDRDSQFQHIDSLRSSFAKTGDPVFSIDKHIITIHSVEPRSSVSLGR